ncbi:platelet endothelial aggregation receptor 1-like [Salarias fasciatus]|uniref:platelet endothelial aggregation receptor 1-like n=1 Tax=Salarias fasciatus TaxID=181472 RepID=UPI001176F8E7|nr:platelet endothelial aggregation receptor 1-like [Salarias fasciatus]
MGAVVPNPTDNTTGSLCPPGSFCQRGLRAGDCWAGFYCDWGSSKADQTLCPAGFFCPGGTAAPIPCPAGTFSSQTGNTNQGNCTTCTPGHYCQVEGTSRPALCPAGHYCPAGVISGLEFPCPPGTVQSQVGASSPDACMLCPAGMFCSEFGQTQPSGLCEAGYFCPAGSTSPNSTEYQSDSTGTLLCPPGHYCPAATGYPLPCPVGSLSVSLGLKAVDECPPCPPGLFCDKPAIADLSQASPCEAGYVCLGGSSSPTPSDGSRGYLCPAGHSCPAGSASALPCAPGTFSPAPGAAHCTACLKGTMCSLLATQEPSTCPAGYYCPAGTALPHPCPSGTLSNQTGASSLSVCSPCPSGLFCSSNGASAPDGPCLEGFFCEGGAMQPTPQASDNFPRNGPCPEGHYCPTRCLAPIPCPLGSIRNTTGGVSMESCSACPAGHYCSTEGLASPTGPCAAGFYCPFDFSSTTPYAFLCPKGHYCPQGCALPLPCPTGEYQPNSGSDSCIPCRPGFYCEEAIVGEPRPCPPYSYCPAGTMVPQPCPNGTHTRSNQGGLQEEREWLGESRVFVLQVIFVFLGVQISPLRDQCLTCSIVSGACSVPGHVPQVFIVLKEQKRPKCALQTLSEGPQEAPVCRTAHPAHLSTGVTLGTQSFICALLATTVMVCRAATSMEGRDPDRVLCTRIELPLEHKARATACPAPLVHTVTAQV